MLPLLLLHLSCSCSGRSPPVGDDTGAVADGGAGGIDADGDGHTAETDCDDADPLVHPDAEEECGDRVDLDCDGVELGCSGVISAGWIGGRLVGDEATTWTGRSALWMTGWTEDAEGLVLVSAAEASPAASDGTTLSWAGSVFGIEPQAFAEGGPIQERASWRLDGMEEEVMFGFAMAPADFDGDGVTDLIASGLHSAFHPTQAGEFWLIPGPVRAGDSLDGLGAVQLLGSFDLEGLGRVTSFSADATGDGVPDLIASHTGHCEDGSGPGGFYVLRDRLDQSRTVDDDDVRYYLPSKCWGEAEDLAVLDLDGDGIDDVATGAKLGGSVIS